MKMLMHDLCVEPTQLHYLAELHSAPVQQRLHLSRVLCFSPWPLCCAEMVPDAPPARGSILCAASGMLEKGEEKLPVLSCWPTTRMQHCQPWVSLSWMYLLSWESREVAETVSQGNSVAIISSVMWIWWIWSSYFILEAYTVFLGFPFGFC